jgi:peptidyl-dipeptidase Dcp
MTETVGGQARVDGGENPLLEEWSGPFGGVPPLDRVRVSHFRPALEAAMARRLSEVEAIAGSGEAPTFENTIEALERSGRLMSRVTTIYSAWGSGLATPDFQEVQREMAPRLAALRDAILQNSRLFARIDAVHSSSELETLTPQQRRLVWRYHHDFVRAGARLDDAAKRRVAEINERLAKLFRRFGDNVLADENERYVTIEREEDLEGLPHSLVSAASEAAEERGMPGRWLISNTRSAVEPFLTSSPRRDLREAVHRMFVSRGDLGGETDNKAVLTEILALRAERARLLGYPTHAHFHVADEMARTPERAMELLEEVWRPAVSRVREEVGEMEEIMRSEGVELPLRPWDFRYFAEKVRKATFDVDEDEVSQYLQLDRLKEGMFWVADELFGLHFRPAPGVPVFHQDVEVWEVVERENGRHVGLFYFDPFARSRKRSGAWASGFRTQESFEREISPLVTNSSNFLKPGKGEAALISWTDATTLFHEFGHALNSLASRVGYPALAGTAPERDFVELPSQLLEHWLSTPELLERFAIHHETGEPMPAELRDRLDRAATFNQGFRTVEYLASAILDMRLHLLEDPRVEPDAYEREALAELGMPPEVSMRHRLPHFSHIFESDGYSSSYYGYLWADVLTADVFEAFLEAGGPYDRGVAARLMDDILSIGSSVDPAEAFRRFRGRDPDVRALMRKRGFVEAST